WSWSRSFPRPWFARTKDQDQDEGPWTVDRGPRMDPGPWTDQGLRPKARGLLGGAQGLLDRSLFFPVQMTAGELALVVQIRGAAESQHVAVELIKAFLLAVGPRCRRALLAVIDELRVLILVRDEPSEVAVVAPIGGKRFGGRRLGSGELRASLLVHQVDHHVAGRGVDDVRGARAHLVPVAVEDLFAV